MSKLDKFKDLLFAACPELEQSTCHRDAFEEALEEVSEEGFNQAIRELSQGEFDHPLVSDLKVRYAYLAGGGKFQAFFGHNPTESYIRGFEDAMKTLGVKP